MTNSIPLSQLETSPAAKFEKIGDAYKGRIVSIEERQQTDTKNTLLFFSNGQPRMQWVIGLEMANGETAALYAKGGRYKAEEGSGESMLNAIGMAVRAAGATGVDVGAELAVAYTGRAAPQPGLSPAKLYTAQYRAATASVPVTNLFSDDEG